MARRLVDAGHDVVVWNRTSSKTQGFPQVAESPSRAADQAEIVITMLSDASSLREVVYDTGVLDKVMRLDGVLVDMATIGIRAAKRLHETIGRATLDAPVGGGVAQAASGELVVLAGGEDGVLGRVADVLGVFGDVVHCGGRAEREVLGDGDYSGITELFRRS